MPSSNHEFFVSYTAANEAWAEWIAWQLERVGQVTIQKWHIHAGDDFVQKMHDFLEAAETVLLVLSEQALESEWVMREVTGAIAGGKRLIVARIENCERPGLLKPLVSIDLFGVEIGEAQARLLQAVRPKGRPLQEPPAPLSLTEAAWTPGAPRQKPETPPEPAHLRRAMRRLFDDSSFSAMCHDNFPKVYERITDGMTLDRKHTLLLDHCRRRGLLGTLAHVLELEADAR